MPRDCDVAIIGAGAAGLVAAVELGRRGLDVCLLEARDRIGGGLRALGEVLTHVDQRYGNSGKHPINIRRDIRSDSKY